MTDNSKELRIAISHLGRLNLTAGTKFKPIVSIYIPEVSHHANDYVISNTIDLINKKFPLSKQEQELYKKDPINFTSLGTIIGIQNSKGKVYRVIRIERYKEYTIFCKQLIKNKFHLFVIHNALFDILFR